MVLIGQISLLLMSAKNICLLLFSLRMSGLFGSVPKAKADQQYFANLPPVEDILAAITLYNDMPSMGRHKTVLSGYLV